MPEIRKVEAKGRAAARRPRVAAYARVSVDKEGPMHSLSAQVSAYSGLIQGNPEWEYAGVYADGGITGTSASCRAEFNRMMGDCEAGKIDLVLVKSISRFARNTVDALKAIRRLKDIGVEVRFEREGISTLSGDGELLFTILASFAQAESESISQNGKWAARKRFEEGVPSTSLRCFGYDWDAGRKALVVNQEEAGWVRHIYGLYLGGASIRGIAAEMRELGVAALRGGPLARSTIRRILTSRLYVGDVVLQKYYTEGPHQVRENAGELPQYVVEGAHEPIVTREEFDAVQERIARRARDADNRGHGRSPIAGKVRCGKCGRACSRVADPRGAEGSARLECNGRKGGGCDLLPIRESELGRIMGEALGARDAVERVTLFDDRVEFLLEGGRSRSRPREFPSGGRMATCFSRRTACGECGAAEVRMRSGTRMCWTCAAKKADSGACANRILTEAELEEAGRWAVGEGPNFGMRYYCGVESAAVYADRIVFRMREGGERTWTRR